MSTKASGADTPFNKSFRKLVLSSVVALTVLFAFTIVSGPRLRRAEVDTKTVTSASGQKLILHANQPLAKVASGDITISPAVPFSVSTSTSSLIITFKQKLNYATNYKITVKDVAAAYGLRHRSSFNYSFQTIDPDMYMLRRAGSFDRTDQTPDTIVHTTVAANGNERTVFSAHRIQQFVVVGSKLAVVTIEQDGKSQLRLVDVVTGKQSAVTLPASGTVDQLQSSSDGKTYGFRFTDDRKGPESVFQNTLFVHNTQPGFNLIALDGIAGKPLQISDWRFASDGTSIVAQGYDTGLTLVDTTYQHQPSALGQFSQLGNFSYDGSKLLVYRQTDYAVLDVRARQQQTLDTNMVKGLNLQTQLLSNQPGEVLHAQDGDSGSLVPVTPQVQHTLYAYQTAKTDLTNFTLTTNDQYVFVSAPSRNQLYDGYPHNAQPLQAQTELVDVATGRIIRTMNGTSVEVAQ